MDLSTGEKKCDLEGSPSQSKFNEFTAPISKCQSPYNKRWLAGKVAWGVVWTVCCSFMTGFIITNFNEFIEYNPITIMTFVDQPEKPDPIVIKLCNNVFLDEVKIREYNGSAFDSEAIQFLKEMVSMNGSANHQNWIYPSPFFDYFMFSPEIFDAFKLDISRFMITCFISGTFHDCTQSFKFHLDAETSCFMAELDVKGYGINRAVLLGFYFDSNVKFGKHSAGTSVFVRIYHPDDYLSPLEGFSIEANEFAIVTETVEQKIQKNSFEKAKCINHEGLQWYSFTGEPFQVSYHPKYCVHLCITETLYKDCNCSFSLGLNITNKNCIMAQKARNCLSDALNKTAKIEDNSKSCLLNCLPKCNRKELKTSVLKEHNKLSAFRLITLLDHAVTHGQKSDLTLKLQHKINSSNDSLGVAEKMLPNMGHLTVYFRNEQQMLVYEVIPYMTFPTFLSNVGGLMGMWLGLSAMSMLEFLEIKASNFWRRYLRIKVAPGTFDS